jgi:hypothetical protein
LRLCLKSSGFPGGEFLRGGSSLGNFAILSHEASFSIQAKRFCCFGLPGVPRTLRVLAIERHSRSEPKLPCIIRFGGVGLPGASRALGAAARKRHARLESKMLCIFGLRGVGLRRVSRGGVLRLRLKSSGIPGRRIREGEAAFRFSRRPPANRHLGSVVGLPGVPRALRALVRMFAKAPHAKRTPPNEGF